MDCTQLSLFGKTSPEHSAPTEARISVSSSSSSSRSSSPMPLFLRLRKADGERPTPYWEMDGQLRGECSTLNFGESPSVAVESTLSQILETTVPARVFWHPTAGGQTRQRTPPDSQDGSRVPSRDQDAGVTEATICMSTGQANAEILTDISAYLNCNHEAPIITTAGFNGWRSVSGSIEFGQECAPCLNTKMPPDIVAAFMGGQGSKAGGIAYSEQVAPTLKAASSGTNMAPCLVAPAWPDRANALLARHDGSPCIDRGQTVVCVPDPTSFCYDCRGNGTENIVSALTGDHQNRVTDYTTIVCVAGCDFRNMKENGDLCGTLQAKPTGGQSLNCIHPVRIGHRVRRLIPTECARLQGFPDWWCADVPHSDAKEYKMWGNGIALPCAAFVIGQVKKHIDEVNYESS